MADRQIIEFDLNPEKESDESKVRMSLDDERGLTIKWYDCSENTNHIINGNYNGLMKLERMALAIEMAKKHVLKVIDNEQTKGTKG